MWPESEKENWINHSKKSSKHEIKTPRKNLDFYENDEPSQEED